jgi:G3E family GTPase
MIFYTTISNLLQSEYEFNHLLIETTGIADPDSIIQVFISSPKIQSHFILDSVISLADAVNLEDMLDKQPEIRKQLVLSDIVLLNKTDKVKKEYSAELMKTVEKINPLSQVYRAVYSDISSIDILDLFLFSRKKQEKTTSSFLSKKYFAHLPTGIHC